MNSMPYGIVQKMIEDGWVARKDDSHRGSGRTLLTHPNHADWKWIDNGIVDGKQWIFLKLRYGDLVLDKHWWPIKVKYTEKYVIVEPKNNCYPQEFSYEDFEYIKKVMQYYKVRVEYEDTRPEYYLKKIEEKKGRIERRKEEIKKFQEDIAELEEQIKQLEEII